MYVCAPSSVHRWNEDVEADDVGRDDRLDCDAGAASGGRTHARMILGQSLRPLAGIGRNRAFKGGSDALAREMRTR